MRDQFIWSKLSPSSPSRLAGGHPCHGRSAELRLRERKCACAGAVRCPLSRAGARADRRAGSADGRIAHDRALRGSHRDRPPRGVPRPLRAGCRARGDAAQAQHGHRRQGVRPPASVEEVATATLRCLRRHVPAAVPGIVFLSGGQNARLATAHLNAINRLPGPKPWKISFSYGRALQDPALEAWHGRDENLAAGQQALYRRASSNGAASVGKYTDEMEVASPSADDPPHRRDWRDD